MTKAEIITAIQISTGFDKKTIGEVVESFTQQVKDNLSKGESVFIRGFGSFITKQRAAKIARNISNASSVKVPAHRIPYFKPAAEFKALVRDVQPAKK